MCSAPPDCERKTRRGLNHSLRNSGPIARLPSDSGTAVSQSHILARSCLIFTTECRNGPDALALTLTLMALSHCERANERAGLKRQFGWRWHAYRASQISPQRPPASLPARLEIVCLVQVDSWRPGAGAAWVGSAAQRCPVPPKSAAHAPVFLNRFIRRSRCLVG